MQAEISSRFGISSLPLNVLALGKLGGRGVDYGSDLDIVLVYPDQADTGRYSAAEVYSRAVDLFVTTLSGMTRDGSLYRVDLRLRPYGTNGASSNPRSVFVDYFRHTAALWEMLAFVKLRGVAGEKAVSIEDEVRAIIHERARCISVGELASEVVRIRHLLERQKAGRDPEADIKYGPGGLLDVYFATRYLQLRDNRPDRPDDRSTIATLEMLWENGSLSRSAYENFSAAYAFLSGLDHNIRLTSGRSRRLPASLDARGSIAIRMNLAGVDELMRAIAHHRLNIRSSFESVVK
jgi:glutamate-ammonia-ligase adenylyltransferase